MEKLEHITTYLYIIGICVGIGALFFRNFIVSKLEAISAKSKLVMVAVSALGSLALIIFIESSFMKKIKIQIDSIAKKDLPLIEKLTKAEFNILESNIFFEKAINMELLDRKDKSKRYYTESDGMVSQTEVYLSEILADLESYLKTAQTSAEIEEFSYLKSGLSAILSRVVDNHKERAIFFESYNKEDASSLVNELDAIDTEAIKIEKKLDEYLIHIEKFTEKSSLKAEHLEDIAISFTLAYGFFNILILSVMIFLINKSISMPISQEAYRISHIAKPSLKRSQDCLKLSHELNHSSDQQLASVTQTASSCEEISQTLDINLKHTENGKKSAEQAKKSVTMTLEAIDKLIVSIDELKKSDDKMNRILMIIETIKEKTAVIDEIVFQTKLLSFNASVEAERAGEHGRGFAVVASEVGNLASNSGKASVEISEILKQSISEVREAVETNKTNIELATTTLDSVLSESNRLKGDIDLLSDSNSYIATASREQTEGVRQVNQAISLISQHAHKISKNAKDLASISNEIVDYSKNLDRSSKVLSVIGFGQSNGNKVDLAQVHSEGFADGDTNVTHHDFSQTAQKNKKSA